MPIYEYKCSDCDYQADHLQKISDAPLVDCPTCHRPSLVKLVSAPSFRLSGSGWYETDFKTDKDKKKNLAGDFGAGGSDSGNSSSEKASTGGDKKNDSNNGASKKTTDPKNTTAKKAVN